MSTVYFGPKRKGGSCKQLWAPLSPASAKASSTKALHTPEDRAPYSYQLLPPMLRDLRCHPRLLESGPERGPGRFFRGDFHPADNTGLAANTPRTVRPQLHF